VKCIACPWPAESGEEFCGPCLAEIERGWIMGLTDTQYRAAARREYEREGEIEIDTGAPVSKARGNPDCGAYVQAWVWVSDEEGS